jgi:hypothetical protein
MAGYSATPLVKKLGIKENFNIEFVDAPSGFEAALALPAGVTVNRRSRELLDLVLLFVKNRTQLEKKFNRCAQRLRPAGMLWISWPKKASGVDTDLTDNVVRGIGLAKGMVDVKVCAVDEVWSGLKFVIRLKDRPPVKSR